MLEAVSKLTRSVSEGDSTQEFTMPLLTHRVSKQVLKQLIQLMGFLLTNLRRYSKAKMVLKASLMDSREALRRSPVFLAELPPRAGPPLPPRPRSVPAPPKTWSVPRPPMVVSSPSSPWIVSLPSPPMIVSLSLPPLSESLPSSPRMASLPTPPLSESFPAPPLIVS